MIFVSNSVLILLIKLILNETAPLVLLLFEETQGWETVLTAVVPCSFYVAAFQDLHKLPGITLTQHNPNMWNERRELRSDLHKEIGCLFTTYSSQTRPQQWCFCLMHLKTFQFVQISLFMSALKHKKRRTHKKTQVLGKFCQQDR